MIRLLLCDLDGTLVETWRTTPLPDVCGRLRVLEDQGVPVVVGCCGDRANSRPAVQRVTSGASVFEASERRKALAHTGSEGMILRIATPLTSDKKP